jgi:tellurite resistance protein
MILQREGASDLRPDQVRAMAHGLYYLAEIDGITEQEKDLIKSFLEDGKVDLELENLAKLPFSIEELSYSLDTMFLRKTFMKICFLLARADGEISAEELEEIRRLAQALEITEPLESLARDLEDKTLE